MAPGRGDGSGRGSIVRATSGAPKFEGVDGSGEGVFEALSQSHRAFNHVGSVSVDADYEVTTEWSPTLSSAASKLPPVSTRGAPTSARDAVAANATAEAAVGAVAAAATGGSAGGTVPVDTGTGSRSSAVVAAAGDTEGAPDFVADIVAEGRASPRGTDTTTGPVPPPIDTSQVRHS